MKITMYELLGMVKDGKAPKLVKYKDYIYSWDSAFQDYVCDDLFLLDFTSISEDLQEYLQCALEILEEAKEIPERLNLEQDKPGKQYYIRNEYGTKCGLTQHSRMIAETLNQVIDYLKSKGDE